MSRPLRPSHLLLLLVPLLLASAPAAPSTQASTQGLFLTDLRVRFPVPPVAGARVPFTVTAIDEAGQQFTNYLGTVNVSITGTQSGADVQPATYVFLGVGKDEGVAPFEARWPKAGPQTVTVKDTLGLITQEYQVNVAPGPAARFDFQLPEDTQAGAPVSITVTAYDANNNVATGFTGPVSFESSDARATVPTGASFTAQDMGQKEFSGIVFTRKDEQTLTIRDASASGSVTGVTRSINVLPGPAKTFQFRTSANTAMAGVPISAQLSAVDAYGNPTVYPPSQPVRFTSTDPMAELPGEVPFGTGAFQFTLKTAGPQDIVITGVSDATGRLDGLQVTPGAFHELILSTPTTQPVATCTPATVRLRAADFYGNTVPGDRNVRLCGTPGGALRFIDSTLEDVSAGTNGCIEGALPQAGVGQVRWSNTAPGLVTFGLEQPQVRPVAISWETGGISPAHSRLSFPGALRDPPLLRTFTGTQRVLFEPRNACNQPVDPPAGQTLSIAVQSPLVRETDAVREQLGRWATTVRLPKCPDTGAAALKVGPTLNEEPLRLPTGALLHADILPNCLPPDVVLELVAKDAKATPGTGVRFELKLSNTGDNPISAGLLWLETASLTALEVSVDGEKVDPSSMKLSLPELAPGETRTVKLEGLAGTQLEVQVMLTAWYTSLEGAALTEQKAVSLDWDELAVDVGCGCQSGALPSQFLPWLALLALASRPRARLRRLTRGERIDR